MSCKIVFIAGKACLVILIVIEQYSFGKKCLQLNRKGGTILMACFCFLPAERSPKRDAEGRERFVFNDCYYATVVLHLGTDRLHIMSLPPWRTITKDSSSASVVSSTNMAALIANHL